MYGEAGKGSERFMLGFFLYLCTQVSSIFFFIGKKGRAFTLTFSYTFPALGFFIDDTSLSLSLWLFYIFSELPTVHSSIHPQTSLRFTVIYTILQSLLRLRFFHVNTSVHLFQTAWYLFHLWFCWNLIQNVAALTKSFLIEAQSKPIKCGFCSSCKNYEPEPNLLLKYESKQTANFVKSAVNWCLVFTSQQLTGQYLSKGQLLTKTAVSLHNSSQRNFGCHSLYFDNLACTQSSGWKHLEAAILFSLTIFQFSSSLGGCIIITFPLPV